jgi:hypothetical protein
METHYFFGVGCCDLTSCHPDDEEDPDGSEVGGDGFARACTAGMGGAGERTKSA